MWNRGQATKASSGLVQLHSNKRTPNATRSTGTAQLSRISARQGAAHDLAKSDYFFANITIKMPTFNLKHSKFKEIGTVQLIGV